MGERIDPQAVERLYAERDYLDAYRAHTDLRVRENPQEAVGGMWEEIGALQFDYLVSHGLQPASRMLDIGCGTLRGGRHFIRYLDAGGYTGFDISAEAVAYARALVEAEGLAEKAPSLVLDADLTLGCGACLGDLCNQPLPMLYCRRRWQGAQDKYGEEPLLQQKFPGKSVVDEVYRTRPPERRCHRRTCT